MPKIPRIEKCMIVLENTPGYMPDSEPSMFKGRGMKRDAREEAKRLRDDLRENGYACKGTASEGYRCYLKGAASKHDLGRVIEVHEGEGPECLDPNDPFDEVV